MRTLLTVLLCASVTTGCVSRFRTQSTLDLRVSDPMKAMRLEFRSATPTETVGEKLSFFISTVIDENPHIPSVPVFIAPSLACVLINGWETAEDGITVFPAFHLTVRECLQYFSEIIGNSRILEKDDVILIHAASDPPRSPITITSTNGSCPFDDATKEISQHHPAPYPEPLTVQER